MFHFSYDEQGNLCAENVPLAQIAKDFSTPTYVYAQSTIERHFRVFDQAFDSHKHIVCYAMKANSQRSVLRILAKLGAGADIVSGGELCRATDAGIDPKRIVFSGVAKRADEMEAALDRQILAFNVESSSELNRLSQVAAAKKKVAPVSLRVNPDVDPKTHPYIATGLEEAKFGVPMEDARALATRAFEDPWLSMVGLDCHIGSQLTDVQPFMDALESVLTMADELQRAGIHLHHIDIGGGLGIPYGEESPPHPTELGRLVTGRMRGRSEMLITEPGRVIVGNAGVLLSRVEYIKKTQKKTFVILDSGMNDLLRPSLYGAYHDIWPVKKSTGDTMVADVVGPICETGDAFAKKRELPLLAEGDLVAVMGAGAYGYVMASCYNSRPPPAEVLVFEDNVAVVTPRMKDYDLNINEIVPDWL